MTIASRQTRINFNVIGLTVTGGNRVILEIANRLQERGNRVTITASGKTGDEKWFGVPMQCKINYFLPFFPIRMIRQRIFKQDFHVVRANMLPKVIPACDINIATSCLTVKPTCDSRKGKPFYLVQSYEPWFYNDEKLQKIAEESYSLPATRLCVSRWLENKVGGIYVGNGVNKRTFYPRNDFEEKEPNSVMIISRGISWKNDDLAFSTLRKIHEAMPDVKIHVVKSKELEFTTEFPYQLHVKLSDDEIARLYSSCRAFLYASKFEGFGLPPLEAMACGTSVVSTNFEGNEFLTDEKNSLLAQESDELANNIIRLFSDDDLSKELVKNGFETVKEYDFDIVVDRIMKAINEVI